MRRAIFFCMLISCANDSTLSRFCPNKCYTGPANTLGVGACVSGVPVCDEDFNVIYCKNEVRPAVIDTCDGIDNDCDGKLDEDFDHDFSPFNAEDTNLCGTGLGVCYRSKISCVNGVAQCIKPSTYEPGDEVSCDGLDNDCDGAVDEGIVSNEFCFDGDFWQATNPPCRPGLFTCVRGNIECVGQVTPTKEICDSVDNDCDGVVDDTTLTLEEDYDIVLAIDTSGSMCGEIAAVSSALSMFASQFSDNPHFRFALVNISAFGGNYINMLQDLSDFSIVQPAIANLGCSGNDRENSLDAMSLVCGADNSLGLTWRRVAKRMILLFTDEPPQSYVENTTVHNVALECFGESVVVNAWVTYNEFAEIPGVTGGQTFEVTNNRDQMLADLNSIMASVCVE